MTARILQGPATLMTLAILVNVASAQAPQAQTPQAAPQVAAIVNGEVIPMEEVEALVNAVPTATPLTDLQRRQRRNAAVENLVDDRLMKQFLRKHGPKIEPTEVSKYFKELEEALKKDGKTLQDFYKETKQNEFQVRTGILNMLQWASYAKNHFSDADVKKYYDENLDFFNQVTVRASHIMIRVGPNNTEVERQSARTRLQALRQEVVAGKVDFAEAAKKHSQCPSAPNGGDIGYFPRKWVVDEPFAKTAFAMKPGEVSDIVQTEFGLHIIKVLERKPGTPADFTKIKNEVREMYVEEMRLQMLAQERRNSQVQINVK